MIKKDYAVLTVLLLVLAAALSIAGVSIYKTMFAAPEPAPDFSIADLSGKAVTLSDLKGKVIFLNFWAPRCDHGINQMPSMQRLHDQLGSRGLLILAVSIGEEKDKIDRCLKGKKYTFRFFSDPQNNLARAYKITSIPTNLLIDKKGLIVFNEIGSRECDTKDFINKIEKLL